MWAVLAVLALLGSSVSCGNDGGAGPAVEPSASSSEELDADEAAESVDDVGDRDGAVELSLESSALTREELDADDLAVLEEIEAELEAFDLDAVPDDVSVPIGVGDAPEFGVLPAETAYVRFEGVGSNREALGPVELAKGEWLISFAFRGNADESGAVPYFSVDARGADYLERAIDGETESGELTYVMWVGLTEHDNPPGPFEFEVWVAAGASWELFIHPL